MKDYLDIGSSPCDEDCAQLGSENYYMRAKKECLRFIELIRKVCGEEEGTADLRIKSNPHDFGTYYSVVCYFDDEDELGMDYAYWVEANTPQTWDDEADSAKFVKSLTQTQVKEILKKVYNHTDEEVKATINCFFTDKCGYYSAPRFTKEEEVKRHVDKCMKEVDGALESVRC